MKAIIAAQKAPLDAVIEQLTDVQLKQPSRQLEECLTKLQGGRTWLNEAEAAAPEADPEPQGEAEGASDAGGDGDAGGETGEQGEGGADE